MKSLWTQRRSDFKGRYYQLSDAPLDPKPVQTPHPELMIGGGGERVTLRIVAKHADHWNVWGGPRVLAKKGAILDEHCTAVGRDPKNITRSANMVLLITDKKDEIERLAESIATRRAGSSSGRWRSLSRTEARRWCASARSRSTAARCGARAWPWPAGVRAGTSPARSSALPRTARARASVRAWSGSCRKARGRSAWPCRRTPSPS